MPRFKKLASYKHELAIDVLKSWFEPEYIVEIEKPFFINGVMTFVPDLTLLQETTVRAIYEVTHTHGLKGKKLGKIQSWCYRNYDVPVYEVSADWILERTEKPDRILSDKFETVTHEDN